MSTEVCFMHQCHLRMKIVKSKSRKYFHTTGISSALVNGRTTIHKCNKIFFDKSITVNIRITNARINKRGKIDKIIYHEVTCDVLQIQL